MKTNNQILRVILLLSILITFSCNDILINENPNGTNLDELPPEVILPGAQTRTASTFIITMNQLGNTMIATWSGNAQQIQAPYFNEFSYQLSTDFYSNVWDNLFIRTSNLSIIVNYESAENYDYYKAAAKILRTFYIQYLVDVYGDIPYTDIHLRGDLLFPSYDNQEEVYRALITEIDQAIEMINNTDTSTVLDMGSNDVMLNGDMSLWKKFGNTIKLRLLVRLMNLAETDNEIANLIQTSFNSFNNANTEFLEFGEDIRINPGYSDEDGKMNPFAAQYGYDPGEFGNQSSATTSNVATGPTTFLVEMLNGNSNGVFDPRLQRLYTTRPGQVNIQGNTQGGLGQPSRLGEGLLSSPSQDGFIMTAVESLLLQSEARFRGYLNYGADAKTLFQNGIRASFNMLGAGSAEPYLLNSNLTDKIGWDGSLDKIEAIITQKWIALGGTNGIETWIEYNRTGFPSNMPLPEITSQTSRPKRLLYPTSEYTGNSENVSQYGQTVSSAFNTNIFWDVN